MVIVEDKKSLLQTKKVCYVCGTARDLHYHHIFYGSANRKKSDEDLMGVWLCGPHHNLSSAGVHFNKKLDEVIKKQAEKIWIKTYCTSEQDGIEEFVKRYHINYLDYEDL